MNATIAKTLGFVLASALLLSSVALAEGIGNRASDGRALDVIGQSHFDLTDDTANVRSDKLPVYDSGSFGADRSAVN